MYLEHIKYAAELLEFLKKNDLPVSNYAKVKIVIVDTETDNDCAIINKDTFDNYYLTLGEQ